MQILQEHVVAVSSANLQAVGYVNGALLDKTESLFTYAFIGGLTPL